MEYDRRLQWFLDAKNAKEITGTIGLCHADMNKLAYKILKIIILVCVFATLSLAQLLKEEYRPKIYQVTYEENQVILTEVKNAR